MRENRKSHGFWKITRLGLLLAVIAGLCIPARAISGTPLTDTRIVLSSTGTEIWTASGTQISGICDAQGENSVLTIKASVEGTISFDYTIKAVGASRKQTCAVSIVTEDGTKSVSSTGGTASAGEEDSLSGEMTVAISSEQSFTVSASWSKKSLSKWGRAEATLSNIKFTPSGSSEVTLNPAVVPANLSYQANYLNASKESASSAVSGASVKVVADLTGGVTIPAVSSGNDTYCLIKVDWSNGSSSGTYYPDENGYFLPTAGDVLSPYFIKNTTNGTAPFKVGTKTYWTWETAFAAAGGSGTVILVGDYALPTTYAANGMSGAGNFVTGTDGELTYKIPSGVTFVVPYKDGDTGSLDHGYLNRNNNTSVIDVKDPTPYVTLTVAGGTTVRTEGALVNNAYILRSGPYHHGYNGVVYDDYGRIDLERNGHITIENGGIWYARGYTAGSGDVTVKSGGTLQQMLQILDWVGGDNSIEAMFKGLTTNEANGTQAFPFNNFYIANILSTVTYEYGSIGSLKVLLYIPTTDTPQEKEVNFISKGDSLFVMSEGSAIQAYYDSETQKFVYNFYGNISLGSLEVEASVVIVTVTVNSKYSVLPFNGNYQVNIESGTFTVENDVKFLPGVIVTVEEGATLKVIEGKNLYLYRGSQYSPSYNKSTTHYSRLPIADVFGNNTNQTMQTIPQDELSSHNAELHIYGNLEGNVWVSSDKYIEYSVSEVSATNAVSVTWTAGEEKSWANESVTPCIHLINEGTYSGNSSTSQKEIFEYINNDGRGVFFDPVALTLTEAIHQVTAHVTDPTCLQEGYVEHICDICADDKVWLKNTLSKVAHESSGCICVAKIGESYYTTLAAAVDQYQTGNVIQMIKDSKEESCQIETVVYLDLNGRTVSGVTIDSDSGGILYGADSSSDGFKTPGGSITVSGSMVAAVANNVNGKDYVAYSADGKTYSFHRFAITPTDCQFYLNPNSQHAHLSVMATLQGDSTIFAQNLVKDLGFQINSEAAKWYGGDMSFSGDKTISYIALTLDGNSSTDYKEVHSITALAAFDADKTETALVKSNACKITLKTVLDKYISDGGKHAADVQSFLDNLTA